MQQSPYRITQVGTVTAAASAIYDWPILQKTSSIFQNLDMRQLSHPMLLDNFKTHYHLWIKNSQTNQILGLEYFLPFVTQAITHSFDSFIAFHSDKRIRLFKGEYPYYKNVLSSLPIQWGYIDDFALTPGDAIVLSAPFSATGEIHPKMYEIFQLACDLEIPVFVDCAFWGICQNIHLDLRYPCIDTVAFSLSKCFGLGTYRIGICYSKNVPPQIRLTNEWSYVNFLGAYIGLELLKIFSVDYIPTKYGPRQIQLAAKLGLQVSSTIIFAMGTSEWKEFQRDGTNYFRICLSPILNQETLNGQSRHQPPIS